MSLQQSYQTLQQAFDANDLASVGKQLPALKVRPTSSSRSIAAYSHVAGSIDTLETCNYPGMQLLLTQTGLLFPTGQATSADDLVTAREIASLARARAAA